MTAPGTGGAHPGGPPVPIYREVMGGAFDRLAPPIRGLHELTGATRAEGRATVERGTGLPARLVAALMRFPAAGRDVPLRVAFDRRGARERWRRQFADRCFASTQEVGRGRFAGLLVERFGPMAVGLEAREDRGRLRLAVRRWGVCGIPMPSGLGPGCDACEHDADGRFNFEVELTLPVIGLIVRYRGWLEECS